MTNLYEEDDLGPDAEVTGLPEDPDEADGLPVTATVPPAMRKGYRARLLLHEEGGTGGRAGGPRRCDSSDY